MPTVVGIAGKPVSEAEDAERVSILGKVGMNSWRDSLCLFPGICTAAGGRQNGGAMKDRLKSSHKQFKKDAKNTLYSGLQPKKRQKKEEKTSYTEEISNRLGIPADILAGAPIITATGRNELSIENYKGLIEYNGDKIKVQTKQCKVCIEGKQLDILYFTEDEMRVTGYIHAIYYQ